MIETEFLYEARIEIAPVLELGKTLVGQRRIINITGGTFEGPDFKGTILPGGADWQVIRADGSAYVEARYTMQTEGGALIYVINKGFRHGPQEVIERLARGDEVDPREYYFRTTPFFETSDPKFEGLNRTVSIATGARHADAVVLKVFAVK